MLMMTKLYIFWFLHQTTTRLHSKRNEASCISFDSYIKPQRSGNSVFVIRVVYLLIPTSNHNHYHTCSPYEELYIFWFLHQTTTITTWNNILLCCISFDSYIKPQQINYMVIAKVVVYLLIPTSNHNVSIPQSRQISVVYLLIPTSNHNVRWITYSARRLYIFWFLHQTTTDNFKVFVDYGCISFDSYIKPQRKRCQS